MIYVFILEASSPTKRPSMWLIHLYLYTYIRQVIKVNTVSSILVIL